MIIACQTKAKEIYQKTIIPFEKNEYCPNPENIFKIQDIDMSIVCPAKEGDQAFCEKLVNQNKKPFIEIMANHINKISSDPFCVACRDNFLTFITRYKIDVKVSNKSTGEVTQTTLDVVVNSGLEDYLSGAHRVKVIIFYNINDDLEKNFPQLNTLYFINSANNALGGYEILKVPNERELNEISQIIEDEWSGNIESKIHELDILG
jgi:hypothetical protein